VRLRVLLPDRALVDERVDKVVAETTAGSRGILPRHIDFVAPLAQGILVAALAGGGERFVAHDRGLLVKKGDGVTVTTIRAAASDKLEDLRAAVAWAREMELEEARAAGTAYAQLEYRLVKEFLELLR